jgi:hypothetical protein
MYIFIVITLIFSFLKFFQGLGYAVSRISAITFMALGQRNQYGRLGESKGILIFISVTITYIYVFIQF